MTQRTPHHLLQALRLVTADPAGTLPRMGAVQEAHLNHLRVLVADRNVVGVGISEKTTSEQTTGELSLCFYVRRKLALRSLRAHRLVPPFVVTGGRLACTTDVKEIGTCRPHASNGARLRSGASVSHVGDAAGTIGAIVQRAGKPCILSNAHVLARSGKARAGDPVVSPGSTDGGRVPADQVARLAAFVPFNKDGPNLVDAAVAELLPGKAADLSTDIPGVVRPVRTAQAQRGMQVSKFGRTTQHTSAHVIDTHFRVTLPYPGGLGLLRFVDQVLCTAFADPGDSGALVIAPATGRVVGLHFAGNDNVSICNPIGAVLAALDISFAGQRAERSAT